MARPLLLIFLMKTNRRAKSHGSQDLYPTMLTNQYNFSANAKTVTQVVANLGALAGGNEQSMTLARSIDRPLTIFQAQRLDTVRKQLTLSVNRESSDHPGSQIFGRRFSIIVMCVLGGVLLYPYSFVSNKRIMAAAFFEQFCVQGAWGVIPIHLMELSPGSFRTFVVGTSYQLGNLVSSASSTIESTVGERFPLPPKGKTPRYKYGLVICIFMACVYVYVIILTLLGPENLGRRFDVEHDDVLSKAAGRDAVEAVARKRPGLAVHSDSCEADKSLNGRY